jgi:EAL domain-containing protein (putative c-di-GMP-specific phosphodiesterase class I)
MMSSLEADLDRAIAERQFVLHFQPKVALRTGQPFGMEALIRWQHPEHGLLSPGAFIPLAESTGSIVRIGSLVLVEACRQMREWTDAHVADSLSWMSVNLSPRQFDQSDLVAQVEAALGQSGLEAHYLDLEITETVAMSQGETARHNLRELKQLGVEISIDDFGSGYSSLASLKHLPVDNLKIDRAFVEHATSEPDGSIISAIVQLAQAIGVKATAEGIETTAQLQKLRGLDCPFGQGFLFSRPLTADDAWAFFKRATAPGFAAVPDIV